MSRKFLGWTYLILAILFVITGFLTERYFSRKYSQQINAQSFEKVLHKKETLASDRLQDLAKLVKLHEFTEINGIYFFDSLDISQLAKEQIYLVIYEFDTLRFWTDNHIDLPLVKDRRFDLRINKIGNAWYEVYSQKFGEYTVLALIKLKDEFPYSNKYLQDKFAVGFSVPGSVRISLIPVSYGFDIKSKDGDYLFTLVPSNTVVPVNKHGSNLPLVFYMLAFFAIIALLYQWLKDADKIYGAVLLVLFVIVRVIMVVYRIPEFFYSYKLFSPILSGYSIGDLIIDSVLALFLIFFIAHNFSYAAIRLDRRNILFDFMAFLLMTVIVVFLMFLLYDLFVQFIVVSDFSFEVYKILKLSFESVAGILAFGFAIMVVLYTYAQILEVFNKYLRISRLILVIVLVFAGIFALNALLGGVVTWGKLWILLSLSVITLIMTKEDLGVSYVLLLIALFTAIIVTDIIFNANSLKFDRQAKQLADKVQNMRDPVAEQLLKDIEKRLDNDEVLSAYLNKPATARLQQKIAMYLYKEYFQGYWKKYNLNVVLCSNSLDLPQPQSRQTCANRYGTLTTHSGRQLTDKVYFVSKNNGIVTYLIKISSDESDLYIELSPKVLPKKPGYPELLLDTDIQSQIPDNFSYAKYIDNTLVVNYGEFSYPVKAKVFSPDNDGFVNYLGYRHYVKHIKGQDSLVVVSYPQVKFIDILITLAYLFVFFILIELGVMVLFGFADLVGFRYLTIKNKLIVSMIGILTVAFLSLGIVTVYFNVLRFKQQFREDVKNKIHSAANALEVTIDSLHLRNDDPQLAREIRSLAQILDADINLYNSRGQLVVSSRNKIFENKLLGQFINYQALEKLLYEQKSEFITQEKIGLLEFTSAYAAVALPQGNIQGFVNIPFFANPEQLHEQISNLIVTLINIYVVLFLLTVALAVLISEQVIAPLKVLQQKFKRLKIGQKYEKIDYKRNDEIGQLVEEYNKMVEKLEQSIDLLAKTERESAWREMAKQIAHEIKNPLTPMKLSIQLLQRAWENKDKNFDRRLKEVTKTLIEQIETLRNIAEEFSAFAKMPVSQKEKIDLAQKIENIVKLYENIDNVEVKAIIKRRPVYIWADNKQISRVFINLIKNAIQAIPEGVDGKVFVELDIKDDKALVKVIDNGTGIPEDVQSKLFTPSFTTKSSGMGLGLAMVKNIIVNSEGRIWFDTEVGKGTTFYIEFPLYDESKVSQQQQQQDNKE